MAPYAARVLGTARHLACLTAAAAVLGFGAGLEDAEATTICVPGVATACPGTAGAVGKTDLEEALSYQGSDGKADEVIVAAGTYSENASFEPEAGTSATTFELVGTDPLTVTGAGEGTILTSASAANEYVVNLSYNNTRAITMRDLTVQDPASQPDGLAGGILLYEGDTLERVTVVSLNEGGDGILGYGPGNVVRDCEVRAGGTGEVDYGISSSGPGTVLVEDSTVKEASWALVAGNGTLTARRTAVLDAITYGAIATGGSMVLENSTFTVDDGIGLYLSAAATDQSLTADHVTILNTGGTTYPALEGKKFSSTAGDATMTVSNSIFRGFSSGYKTETPFGPGVGLVKITARYSNLPQKGISNGGTADFSTGNIDADPLFGTDLSLQPGSPSIDAGDPSFGLNTDFLGAPRPVDGNGDGVAVADQGAFEYQPPAKPGGGGGGDGQAPQTKILKGPGVALAKGKAKFRFSSSEAGSPFECKLDRRKVARCKPPKKYSHLKPGKHSFKVWAIDAAGNKDQTPAKRRFRVPAP